MNLYFHVEPPHRWALVDRRGSVVAEGTSDTPGSIDVLDRASRGVAVVPGERVTIHDVAVPARSRAKALASVPYVLEDSLATSVEDLVFTLLEFEPGKRAAVAVVERAYVESLRDFLSEQSVPMDAVVPEYFLVPRHDQAQQIVAETGDGRYALRTGQFVGMMLDAETLELWWRSLDDPGATVATNDVEVARRLIDLGGTAVSVWEIGKSFPEWLAHGSTPVERINVMGKVHPGQAPGPPATLTWVAAAVFGIGLLARIGLDLYDNIVLYRQDQSLDTEIVKVFHEAFPDVRRIVNPRLQMEQRIRDLRASAVDGGAFQAMLFSVAQALPGTNATLDEISFREDAMLVTCTTTDFAALDRLKEKFSQDGNIRVELVSSGSRENKVSARFRIERT